MSQPRSSKVLVVDDDGANRYFKTHVLRQAGFEVIEAENGAQALELQAELQPALLLLDIKLPDISGIRVTERIKAASPTTLVIQTSAAMTSRSDRIAGLEGGADAYLVEPIEPKELVATTRAMLRLSAAEADLHLVNVQLEILLAERTKELSAALEDARQQSARRSIAEETLRHAEKLDALGQLTGSVAHDFNNLLTVIMGGLDYIERQHQNPAADKARLQRYIVNARHAAKDCVRLTRQLLSFTRRAPSNTEIIDIDQAIGGFADILRQAVGVGVAVNFYLRANATSTIDRSQLEAALLNLAVNARDAMSGSGTLTVETTTMVLKSKSDLGPFSVALGDGPFPQQYLRLSISDTGGGIPMDILEHVFEPFFTTKDVGKGSGLGLSQVYGLVRQSDGYVTVRSETGNGTTINLFLPSKSLPKDEQASIVDPHAALPNGSETILVVEDNKRVREVSSSLLDSLGYKTIAVEDAHAALALLKGGEAIDLLFSDIILPNHMSGVDLAGVARSLCTRLKILLTSGYARESEWAGASDNGFPVILKPYTHSELARRIRTVLDAR